MNKLLIAITGLVFAAGAMLTPTAPAHAGMKGRLAVGLAIGALSVMAHENRRAEHRRWKKKRYQARRKAPNKVYTSKKSRSSTKQVAKAEPELAPMPVKKDMDIATLVQNENSSISTAALEPIEETASIDTEPTVEAVNAEVDSSDNEPAEQKSASKLDCKKFFPTVGMTLSVPCE